MGKILIWIGVALIVIGVIMQIAGRFNLGKLPGDIRIERENFSFYLPITSCIIISIILSLILYFVNRSK